jgi:cation:H+ antiporter
MGINMSEASKYTIKYFIPLSITAFVIFYQYVLIQDIFILNLIVFFLTIVSIIALANMYYDGIKTIGDKLKISGFIMGLIVLTFASSIPEILTTSLSSIQGLNDLAFANMIGNMLFQVTILLAIVGIVQCKREKCFSFPKENTRMKLKRDGVFMLIAIGLLTYFLFNDFQLIFIEGVMMIVAYSLYIVIVFITERGQFDEEPGEEQSLKLAIFDFVTSLILLFFISDILIHHSMFLGSSLGFTEGKIGILFIGIVISIPELIITLIGILTDKEEIVIGNIVGITIFDSLISLGIPVLFSPLSDISLDLFLLLVPTLIISVSLSIIYLRTKWTLRIWECIILIGVYVAFIVVFFILY